MIFCWLILCLNFSINKDSKEKCYKLSSERILDTNAVFRTQHYIQADLGMTENIFF
jgi:hypothetical protein